MGEAEALVALLRSGPRRVRATARDLGGPPDSNHQLPQRVLPGSQTILVATTLFDPIEFPADEIRALYRDRWTAELNLRSLKIALDMDVLRGESPDVVRKEIAMHLLAYNLIRFLMWQAARAHGRNLHRLSFTGTLHRLRHMLPLLLIPARCQTAKAFALLRQLLA